MKTQVIDFTSNIRRCLEASVIGYRDARFRRAVGTGAIRPSHPTLGGGVLLNVLEGITDSLDVLGFFVRDLDTKFFLELHDQLD